MQSPGGTCPACAAPLLPWRSVRSSEPSLGQQRFELLRCARCGTAVTVGDAPADLHETGAYRPGAPRLGRLASPALARFDRHRLALLRALAQPPARLLDVGAGRGRFVQAARAAGYDASGIVPAERGFDTVLSSEGLVRQASIADAELTPGSLDVVTVWHVLEHLDDPRGALGRIRSWLAPGAGLLIGVPNLDSLQARLTGEHWYHLDVPRHRVHFTARGVGELLRGSGFTVLRTDHVLLEHNPFGMWQSLVSLATRHPSYLYNVLKRNAPLRSSDLVVTAAALPLAPLAAVLEAAGGLARRGGTIAVLAGRA